MFKTVPKDIIVNVNEAFLGYQHFFHGVSQYNFQRTRNVSPEIERNWKTSCVNLKLTLFTCLSTWQEEKWVIICHKSKEQWVKLEEFFKRRSRTEIYFRLTMYTEMWGKWYMTWWNKPPHFKKSPVQQNIIVLMALMTCETILTLCFKTKNELQILIYQDCRKQSRWLKCRRKCYLFLAVSGVFKSLPEVHKCHSTRDFLILFHPVKIFRYK